MNYRHAFHAGNFADVVKHIALARILTYLHDKPAAFRVIDTHAGAGLYDLTSAEAERGGEWRTGIARLMQARLSEPVMALVKPYLDVVRAFNPPRELVAYPGSPLIARALLRPQDRLVACEVEPGARKRLIEALYNDAQARVVDLDGWTALTAFVPPKERRGVMLIDPPFEAPDEFDRHAGAPRHGRGECRRRASLSARRGQRGAADGGGGAGLRRPSDRQPALDARRRVEGDPAGARQAARPGRRRPLPGRSRAGVSATQADGLRPIRRPPQPDAKTRKTAVVNAPGTVLCFRP
jgi:hypothetical protein